MFFLMPWDPFFFQLTGLVLPYFSKFWFSIKREVQISGIDPENPVIPILVRVVHTNQNVGKQTLKYVTTRPWPNVVESFQLTRKEVKVWTTTVQSSQCSPYHPHKWLFVMFGPKEKRVYLDLQCENSCVMIKVHFREEIL